MNKLHLVNYLYFYLPSHRSDGIELINKVFTKSKARSSLNPASTHASNKTYIYGIQPRYLY